MFFTYSLELVVFSLFYIQIIIAGVILSFSLINIVELLLFLLGNLVILQLFKIFKLKFYFNNAIGKLSYYPPRRLLKSSRDDPRNGRVYFKIYLFRLMIKSMWASFLSLPNEMKKRLIATYIHLYWVFDDLLYDLVFQREHYFSDNKTDFISIIKIIKLRALEKVFYLSKEQFSEQFERILQQYEECEIKAKLIEGHVQRFSSIIDRSNKIEYNGTWKRYCKYRQLSKKFIPLNYSSGLMFIERDRLKRIY